MILQMDIEWPASLPLPFIDYSGNPRNATITTPSENPSIVHRQRFTRSYSDLSVVWHFDDDQLAIFTNFVSETLGNGTAQFKMELKYPLNSALTEWAVRLGGGYESTYEDGVWKVMAGLELMNPINF